MAVTYVTKSSAGLIPAGVVNDDLLIAVVTGMANKSLAFFPGRLAACALYNAVLSAAQVTNHYSAGA